MKRVIASKPARETPSSTTASAGSEARAGSAKPATWSTLPDVKSAALTASHPVAFSAMEKARSPHATSTSAASGKSRTSGQIVGSTSSRRTTIAVCQPWATTRTQRAGPPPGAGSRRAGGRPRARRSRRPARPPPGARQRESLTPPRRALYTARRAREDPMANERGLIAKARREELSEELRSMLGRWYRNAYEDDNLFLTMARRPALLEATWGFIRYIYGGGSNVEPELFELVRVKLAW